MIRAAAILLGLTMAVPVPAAEIVWRSSSSGVLPLPAPTVTPTLPMPPEAPVVFALSIVGDASVTAGAALDLRPVAAGASGPIVSFRCSASFRSAQPSMPQRGVSAAGR
jgi:hypothetical protein